VRFPPEAFSVGHQEPAHPRWLDKQLIRFVAYPFAWGGAWGAARRVQTNSRSNEHAKQCLCSGWCASGRGGFVVPSFSWADDSTWADGDLPSTVGDGDDITGFGLADFNPAAMDQPDEMVEFIRGAPGELTINAGYGMAAFPVPTSTLWFGSEEEYQAFMRDVFNADFPIDPDTGIASLSLSVTVVGIPYKAHPDGKDPVEVDDPITTFLGGPHGYYVVGNRIVCVVDPAQCPVECGDSSASSAPPAMAASSLSQGGSEATPPSLMMAAPNAGPQQFGVETFVWRDFIDMHGNPTHYKVWAEAVVVPKPYHTYFCGSTSFSKIGNIVVRLPVVCSSVILNPNQVDMKLESSTSDFWTCRLDKTQLPTRTFNNVTRVRQSFNPAQYGRGPAFMGMRSEVSATHLGTSAHDTHEWCWGTGCYTSSPCK